MKSDHAAPQHKQQSPSRSQPTTDAAQPEAQPQAEGELTQAQILRLQRTVGNQAAQRMIAQRQAQRVPIPAAPRPARRNHERPQSQPSALDEPAFGEEQSDEPTAYLAPPSPINTGQPDSSGTSTAPVAIAQTAVTPNAQSGRVQRGLLDSVVGAIGGGAEWLFEKALGLAGVPVGMVMSFLKNAGGAFINIIQNPGDFLGNLIGGVKQGFSNFSDNISTHLKGGLFSWLFGALSSTGIEVPQTINLKAIFSLVTQVMGVTVGALRERLVRFVGAKNVTRVEKAWGIVSKFISDGVGGLWELLKDKLTDLKTMVVDQIKNWVIVEVVKNAVVKILSMFNPAGALIQIITTIYRVVRFFIERAAQIASLGQALFESVGALAAGSIGALAQKIEQSLARAIPVVLGFLANLLGISGIANKIREIIQRIQQKVQDAIDAVLKKIAAGVNRLMGRGKGKEANGAEKADAGVKSTKDKAGREAITAEEERHVKDGAITYEGAEAVATQVQNRRSDLFKSIKVVDGGQHWDYEYTLVQTALQQGKTKSPNLPVNGGRWSSSPGGSFWISDKPIVQDYAKARNLPGIPFLEGFPNFRPWAKAAIDIGEMSRVRRHDFSKADYLLAKKWAEMGDETYLFRGEPNAAAVKRFRQTERYTWHHHQGMSFMVLVPMELHRNVPHSGGVSRLEAENNDETG